MAIIIASADRIDLSEGNWRIVLIWAAVLLAACVLAFIPMVVARARRRHLHAETILALSLLWALVAAGSAGYAIRARINWEKEYDLRIRTGFFDPQDQSDAPQLPWANWGLLGLGYAAVLIWAGAGSSRKTQT